MPTSLFLRSRKLSAALSIFLLTAFHLCLAEGTKPTSATIDIFYTGKRRGNLEPCGCRSRQAGGLQYEATLYDTLANTSTSLRLDAGEWTNLAVEQHPLDALKSRYILRALGLMHFDAVGVGAADAHLSPEFFRSLTEKHPQGLPPLLAANVFEKELTAPPAFPAWRIVRKTLADGTPLTVGLTAASDAAPSGPRLEPYQVPANPGEPSGAPPQPAPWAAAAVSSATQAAAYRIAPAREALAPVVAELRPKVDLLVVLFAGDMTAARELARALPEVDCIVAGVMPLAQRESSAREGRVSILAARGIFGREVGRARLERRGREGWRLAGTPESIAVGPEFSEKQGLAGLIAGFREETHALEVALPSPNALKIYAGVATCAKCHKVEYERWKKTRHAGALQTLMDKGQQFNPECLKCHVTGHQQSNGFYTLTHAPSLKMTNVQCEICHGPARDHAETQQKLADNVRNWLAPKVYQELLQHAEQVKPTVKIPESTCLKCHTMENDGEFVYGVKLMKVTCMAIR